MEEYMTLKQIALLYIRNLAIIFGVFALGPVVFYLSFVGREHDIKSHVSPAEKNIISELSKNVKTKWYAFYVGRISDEDPIQKVTDNPLRYSHITTIETKGKITETDLKNIAKLKYLSDVYIRDGSVTKAGIDYLSQSLPPSCSIEIYDGDNKTPRTTTVIPGRTEEEEAKYKEYEIAVPQGYNPGDHTEDLE